MGGREAPMILPPHHRARRGATGQALTELALILPILVLLLLAIVEFAGAFAAKSDLQGAAAQGTRIGALLGNGGATSQNCVAPDPVDMTIINAVTSTHNLKLSNIQQIQIYNAALDGSIQKDDATQVDQVDTYTINNGVAISTTYGWGSCKRDPSKLLDSVAVRVTYRYDPILAIPGLPRFTLTDQTSQRINPTKGAVPCPIPGIPLSVNASVSGTQPPANPVDIVAWNAQPGVSQYNVYASVNGAAYNATPVATVSLPPQSGIVQTTVRNPTFAPALYEVTGYNSCGEGDRSLPDSNGQCPLPQVLSIISATASITSPGSDYLSWTPSIAQGSYVFTQTPSIALPPLPTVSAPLTETLLPDPTQGAVTYTMGQSSACGVVGPTSLPATRVPTPTQTPFHG